MGGGGLSVVARFTRAEVRFMPRSAGDGQFQRIFVVLVLVLVCVLFSFLIPKVPTVTVFALLGGLLAFGISFLSPQAGLFFLIIAMLLSPEFGGGGVRRAKARTRSAGSSSDWMTSFWSLSDWAGSRAARSTRIWVFSGKVH